MCACNLSQKQIKFKNKRFLRLKFENESTIKNENVRKYQKAPPTLFLKVYKVVSLPFHHFSTIFNLQKPQYHLVKRKFLWYTLGEYK